MYKSLRPQPCSHSTTAFIPHSIFRGQVPRSLSSFVHLSFFSSYLILTFPWPVRLLHALIFHVEMISKSFIALALSVLALTSSVNAAAIPRQFHNGLVVRKGIY